MTRQRPYSQAARLITERLGVAVNAAATVEQLLRGFQLFKNSPASQPPKQSPRSALWVCVDSRCAPAHVFGADRGAAFVVTSPAAIVEDMQPRSAVLTPEYALTPSTIKAEPGDKLFTTLRIASNNMAVPGVALVMPHSGCKAMEDMILGVPDPFLESQRFAVFKQIASRYANDGNIQSILQTPRGQWTPSMHEQLRQPMEEAIAILGVTRIEAALDMMNVPHEKRPTVVGAVYQMGGDALSAQPLLMIWNRQTNQFLPVSDLYEETSRVKPRKPKPTMDGKGPTIYPQLGGGTTCV